MYREATWATEPMNQTEYERLLELLFGGER